MSLRYVLVLAVLVVACGGADLEAMMGDLIEEGVVSCDQPLEWEDMTGCEDVILGQSLSEDAMGYYLASKREQGEPVVCGDGWFAIGPDVETLARVTNVLGGEPC